MENTRTTKKVTLTAVTVLAMLLLLAGTASAQKTGTLSLQGTVPEILEISVNPAAGASSLDLTQDVSGVEVATVVEKSNKTAGYTVTIESANGSAQNASSGLFVHTDAGINDSLSYQISYGGSSVTLTDGTAVVSDSTSKTAGTGNSNKVAISYNGASEFPYEGTYEDTLTFTIAAK